MTTSHHHHNMMVIFKSPPKVSIQTHTHNGLNVCIFWIRMYFWEPVAENRMKNKCWKRNYSHHVQVIIIIIMIQNRKMYVCHAKMNYEITSSIDHIQRQWMDIIIVIL